MSAQDPVELELEGLTVTCLPLPYERSEDILPDVAQIVASVAQQAVGALESLPQGTDLAKMDVVTLARLLGPAVATAAEKLGKGELKRLAPLIMWTTSVVMEDSTGQKANLQLMKAKDRAEVFNAHPEAYFPILFFAGKVTFARYFPVIAPSTSVTKAKVT